MRGGENKLWCWWSIQLRWGGLNLAVVPSCYYTCIVITHLLPIFFFHYILEYLINILLRFPFWCPCVVMIAHLMPAYCYIWLISCPCILIFATCSIGFALILTSPICSMSIFTTACFCQHTRTISIYLLPNAIIAYVLLAYCHDCHTFSESIGTIVCLQLTYWNNCQCTAPICCPSTVRITSVVPFFFTYIPLQMPRCCYTLPK